VSSGDDRILAPERMERKRRYLMTQGVIKRRIVVEGGQVAFEAGEQVTVESVQPNPQNPAYKYVVFSSRLQKRYQLSDDDIQLTQAQQPQQPYPPEVMPPFQQVSLQLEKPGSKKKWIWIGVSVGILVIVVILVVLLVILPSANRKAAQANTCKSNLRTIDGAIQTYQANTETDVTPDTFICE